MVEAEPFLMRLSYTNKEARKVLFEIVFNLSFVTIVITIMRENMLKDCRSFIFVHVVNLWGVLFMEIFQKKFGKTLWICMVLGKREA